MMFRNRFFKQFLSLVLTVSLTFTGMIPVIGDIHSAYAADLLKNPRVSYSSSAPINSSTNWSQVDKYLIDAIRSAHDSTEEFAVAELNLWVDELMKKVDDRFMNWYFSYFNQKAMEFGVPFAWMAFQLDFLNLLKKENESNLNANQILQKRMIEDFDSKFKELVLKPEEAQQFMMKLTERVARNYASALGMKLATTQNAYQIPDRDWEIYLNNLATVIYGTGNSQSSLNPETFGKVPTDVVIFTTAAVGGKLALSFAGKVAAKIAGKAAGAVVAKVSAQLIDPLLAVGILVWDVWDYDKMVNESRPVLRQNILDYLNEVKWSILSSPENSIIAAIEDVEGKITTGLESRLSP
jgi:hypothetical protein